jgi:hypothetical protein
MDAAPLEAFHLHFFHGSGGSYWEGLMYANLVTNSWVSIRGGCQMRYCVNDDDSADFAIKDGSQVFEFEYAADALRQFVELARKALVEMDQLRERVQIELE